MELFSFAEVYQPRKGGLFIARIRIEFKPRRGDLFLLFL
jgi:hypothetical protein